ncbi:carbon monoxide dehydrogenase [Bradyrhizobium cajani]|uniref:Carbon monoxide dehydrogenase n=2 Tax=Bradyrhizobium cajani TaxID=1928661 RepID=A0A844TB92_9BRAD|nr:carbon monoxide dehydrogenase subunit G [Bradyrhizobium cajani]MCP3371817.1 carbon monoxide dehydrogenase subunit G [Bradyrhizobium cajani]MVT76363.1 carbon monoxide dehydrogenase [Bradyrhizobium cajani]
MNIEGTHCIAASREVVWAALNDPAALCAFIPGCESIEAHGPNDMAAVVVVKVGPVRARFTGRVKLACVDPPNSYTIVGEGQGGIAGHAKGEAKVRLVSNAAGTVLTYVVTSQVGGKLAQLGLRLIEGTARKLAGEFFARFAARLEPKASAAPREPNGESPVSAR